MRVELCVDQRALRRWHVDLVRSVRDEPGMEVGIRWAEPALAPLPSCIPLLFDLERLVHRVPPGASGPADPADLARYVGRGGIRPDVVIDLTGAKPAAGLRRLRLTFDGAGGEAPLLAALLGGRMPVVALVEADTGFVAASGRPGTERPQVVVAAFEDVLARAGSLVLAALRPGAGTVGPAASADALSCGTVALFGAKALARAAVHRIYRLLTRAPHWRTGWRFVDGPDVIDLGRHPEGGWHRLADDGRRFYADPFPINVDGRDWVLVEDLEHRTGKGVISAVPFDARGPRGTPVPVLEQPFHLSYPFVFEHGGSVWMIPESSANRTVDLYRATRFPEGWVREATLLDGVEASDATPFRHGDRWWMTATVRDRGGSYSDALHLWSADALPGPWTPHPGNPVLIDLATARPAGRVVRRGGRLIRPVQDCTGGYGSALGLAEIVRLDERHFEQVLRARIGPGPLWPGRRLHTLNRAGRLECIDGSAIVPRLPGLGRSAAAPVPPTGRPLWSARSAP